MTPKSMTAKFKIYSIRLAVIAALIAVFNWGLFEGVHSAFLACPIPYAGSGASSAANPIPGEYSAATYFLITMFLIVYLILKYVSSAALVGILRIMVLVMAILQCRIAILASERMPSEMVRNSLAIRSEAIADIGLLLMCIGLICFEFYLLRSDMWARTRRRTSDSSE